MLLAIDTATRTISLALHDGQRVVAESSWLTANHHTLELAPALAAMMARAGLSARDLRGVAVTLGPGSFTGLRIGLGVAKGLALAAGLALVGMPTLDVLAAAQGPPMREERLCAVLQAGRGRVAAALYEWRAGRWWAAEEAFIATWGDLAARLVGSRTRVAGEVDEAGREALRGSEERLAVVMGAPSLRRAGYLAELGWARLERGEQDDPARLAPIYLHQLEVGVP